MSKGIRIFIKVIYYIFTFFLGVLLAVLLPNWFAYEISMNTITSSLNNGNYSDAMIIVGGYIDKEYVYQESFESGGGIVLFSAATLTYYSGEESSKDETTLHKSYAGFVYGISKSYDIIGNGDNQSNILVTTKNDTEATFQVLDYDSDSDQTLDSSSTLARKDFMYLDFDEETATSIKTIKFIDKNGNTSITINVDLDYSEQFFIDVNDFVEEYNRDYNSSALDGLNSEFLSKDDSYAMSSTGGAGEKAVRRAIIIVIIYFVVIYIIADLALGKRYLIQLFKFILTKVFKVKFKEKPPKDDEKRIEELTSKTFGGDFFSQVTVRLDTSEAEELNSGVEVSYTKDGDKISFSLSKDGGYQATRRVKAGLYVNPWINLDHNYEATNLPLKLIVDTYKIDILIKIIKKERSEDA